MATVEIKFKDLREAVAALNETNLIAEKIKLVGSPKEVILQQFMDVMAKIPDDKEGKFPGPKVSLDYYNLILDAEEKAAEESETKPDTEATSTETPAQETNDKPVELKKEKKEKKDKVIKEKKEKEIKSPSNKLKIYQKWNLNKEEKIEEIGKIAPEIKLITIKTWISAWKLGKNLPAGI